MGWGKGGKGKCWGGPGPGVIAAEALCVGAVAGAVTGAAIAGAAAPPRRRRPREVVVVEQPVVYVVPPAYAQPVYVAPAPPPPRVTVVAAAPAVAIPKAKGKGRGKGAIIAEAPPLRVSRVALPAQTVEERGGVQYYGVDMVMEDGVAWRVMRRYNEFLALNRSCGEFSEPGAPFPQKRWRKCTGERLEARRRALELWLQRTLENPASRGRWQRALQNFLEAGRQELRTAAAPTAQGAPAHREPVSTTPPPAPATPTAPPVEMPSTAPIEEVSVLQIQIPANVSPGQQIAIAVPDGRHLTFEVPQGSPPGSSIQLFFDKAAGTLTPLT